MFFRAILFDSVAKLSFCSPCGEEFYPDRRALKPELLPELIYQVSFVVRSDQFGVGCEHNECRRSS